MGGDGRLWAAMGGMGRDGLPGCRAAGLQWTRLQLMDWVGLGCAAIAGLGVGGDGRLQWAGLGRLRRVGRAAGPGCWAELGWAAIYELQRAGLLWRCWDGCHGFDGSGLERAGQVRTCWIEGAWAAYDRLQRAGHG